VIVAATAAGVALALSLILTPLARGLARRLGITDTPDARRVHQHPTPRGGGIAVAAAVAAALALSCGAPSGPGLWVLAGGALLLAVGAVDDVVSLRVETKLAAQVVAAVLAVAGGLRFELLGLPALLEAGLTVVWIVLITNAFNLTDGLDGLVAGVAVIALLAFGGIVLHAGNAALAIPALALAGALVGFLAYNFHPATIFLGDSGSLLIGYALAVLTLTHPGARTVRCSPSRGASSRAASCNGAMASSCAASWRGCATWCVPTAATSTIASSTSASASAEPCSCSMPAPSARAGSPTWSPAHPPGPSTWSP